MSRNPGRRRAGFTLIEIMVVVVIIGLLASFLIFNFIGQAEDAKVDMTRAMIKKVGEQLDLYKLKYNDYPATLQELVPRYASEVPMDGWKREFNYNRDPSIGGYRLYSFGADGVAGGEEHNADLSNHDVAERRR